MPVVTELDLPLIDHDDPDLRGEHFHEVLAGATAQGWLARTALGYVVLDRENGSALLRDRRMAFPAVELLELQGISSGTVYDRTVNGLMAQTGNAHSRLRRLISPALTPRQINELRPQLRALLAALWEPVAGCGECEFVHDIAERLPSMAVAELLGEPDAAPQLARWSQALQLVFAMQGDDARGVIEQAYDEVREWVFDRLEDRRRAPRDDFISVIATHTEDGDRLDDEECATLICSVISGGTDTTQAQLAHGMRLFAQHPEQWAALRERPKLTPAAAHEVLRFEPITPFTARLAREDVEVDDVVFPAGTVVFVCLATGNRDARVFEDPHRFDITADRGSAQVLTFGFGSHFCLGANLARAELEECFGYLAPRMPGLRLVGEPLFGAVTGIYAMQRLPLAWD